MANNKETHHLHARKELIKKGRIILTVNRQFLGMEDKTHDAVNFGEI